MPKDVTNLEQVEVFPDGVRQVTCRDCLSEAKNQLDFTFSMPFQPIIDTDRGEIFAYEALVRGPNGESARSVLGLLMFQGYLFARPGFECLPEVEMP